MKMHKLLCLILTMLIYNLNYGQEDAPSSTSDLEVWGSVNIAYKINKRLKLNLEEQIRLNEQVSTIDQYFTELSGEYSFNRNLYGSIGARFIRKNDNQGKIQGYENHFRYNIDFGYSFDINRIEIENRLRFQSKNELGVSQEEGDTAINGLRWKTAIGYNFRKWKLDPKLSGELFRRYEEGTESTFNKFRLTLGTNYSLKSHGKVALFYRIEKSLIEEDPFVSNIIGAKYTYLIK